MWRNLILKFTVSLCLIIIVISAPAWRSALAGGFSRNTAVAQAFPYQAGFPRTEPKGINFVSPSVVDLDRDGQLEVLTADGAGCVWAWDAAGRLKSGFPLATTAPCSSGTRRISGPLAIGDVTGDGKLEIVAGTAGDDTNAAETGLVFVWKADGSVLPGWPKAMAWNTAFASGRPDVSTVALVNLAGAGLLEIVAGTTNNASTGGGDGADIRNLYAWSADGSPLSGFPTWYLSAGIWGLVAAADLAGNGYSELVVVRDHTYFHVYDSQGQHLPGWPVRVYVDPSKTKSGVDAKVGFTNAAPAVGDLDGDGVPEIVVVGKVRDPQQGNAITGSALLVFQPDGQRKPGWTIARLSGTPVADTNMMSEAPALVDLNGNGQLEIVVPLRDGTIRAYRANGELLWQYDYAGGRRLFASESVVGDVNGDGRVDVVFGTYSPDHSANDAARLHALDANGQPLSGFPLQLTHEGVRAKQGIRAAPTLADLDGDCDIEIIAASWGGTLYVWDLPAPYQPGLLPWPTGRHDNQRTANTGKPLAQTVEAAMSAPGLDQVSNTTYFPLAVSTGCR